MSDTRTELKHGVEIAKTIKIVGELLSVLFPDGEYATIVVRIGKGLPDAVIPIEIRRNVVNPLTALPSISVSE